MLHIIFTPKFSSHEQRVKNSQHQARHHAKARIRRASQAVYEAKTSGPEGEILHSQEL